MNHYIITGTSRGIGEALARRALEAGHWVTGIARSGKTIHHTHYKHIQFDLTQIEEIPALVSRLCQELDVQGKMVLINNAGILSPIKPAGKGDPLDVIANYQINLIAPVLLSSGFIRSLSSCACSKMIVNILTGAAYKPYYGWSAYCSTKAGLDMFTKTAALEQSQTANPVKVIGFIPGVIDTAMQEQIRNLSKEDFASLERFIALKESGSLLSPDFVARKILGAIDDPLVENGEIIDIKNR